MSIRISHRFPEMPKIANMNHCVFFFRLDRGPGSQRAPASGGAQPPTTTFEVLKHCFGGRSRMATLLLNGELSRENPTVKRHYWTERHDSQIASAYLAGSGTGGDPASAMAALSDAALFREDGKGPDDIAGRFKYLVSAGVLPDTLG